MKLNLFNNILVGLILLVCVSLQSQTVLAAQGFTPVPRPLRLPAFGAPRAMNVEEVEKQDDKKDNTPVTDTATLKPDEEPENKTVRFHMWDGTIITGEVTIAEIAMNTEFGVLQIPIERIRRMSPGLDSFPELDAQIQEYIKALGDKDFDVREKATRALSAMGAQIRNVLDQVDPGKNSEQKKRLAAIQKELDEAEDESEEEGVNDGTVLIRGDTLVTPEFAIVGKIEQQQFTVKSKFGQLTVNLGDIKMADRPFKTRAEEVKKTVSVGGEIFFQRKPVSTRIRVNKGDKISIRADGMVQWTNWSQSSTPDGMTNQGQYQGVNSGTLCARIGSSGKIIKIGSKGEFVAKKNGVLYLAIAIQDNYIQNSGYRWTGNYKAKVHVKPAE